MGCPASTCNTLFGRRDNGLLVTASTPFGDGYQFGDCGERGEAHVTLVTQGTPQAEPRFICEDIAAAAVSAAARGAGIFAAEL